jgi:predicted enzyme related to lactoylglutathione lyase
MGNPVVHWEINSKDAKKAHKFYSPLFNWKIDASNPMGYGMVNTGGDGGINGGIGPAQDRPHVTVYVQVKDLKEFLGKTERLGGKTVVPPTEIPGMVTFAVFTDPDGNRVGLVKG